jgi:hypothetical protein
MGIGQGVDLGAALGLVLPERQQRRTVCGDRNAASDDEGRDVDELDERAQCRVIRVGICSLIAGPARGYAARRRWDQTLVDEWLPMSMIR